MIALGAGIRDDGPLKQLAVLDRAWIRLGLYWRAGWKGQWHWEWQPGQHGGMAGHTLLSMVLFHTTSALGNDAPAPDRRVTSAFAAEVSIDPLIVTISTQR